MVSQRWSQWLHQWVVGASWPMMRQRRQKLSILKHDGLTRDIHVFWSPRVCKGVS